jgi:hypothetical protein
MEQVCVQVMLWIRILDLLVSSIGFVADRYE